MPFLYSIIAHDLENKSHIPFYKFITTSHSTKNIEKYLMTNIKIYIQNLQNDGKISWSQLESFEYACQSYET